MEEEKIFREKKTNCRPPALCRRGRDGFLPPSTANYCHILNLCMRNLGEKKFSGINTKTEKTRDGMRIWNNALSYTPGKSSWCIGKNKVAVTVCLIGSLDTIY